MVQDTRVTLAWALSGLERSLHNLGDGLAERRVRRQFHQLLLALERDEYGQMKSADADETLVARANDLTEIDEVRR